VAAVVILIIKLVKKQNRIFAGQFQNSKKQNQMKKCYATLRDKQKLNIHAPPKAVI
jgi:hypothetical protein